MKKVLSNHRETDLSPFGLEEKGGLTVQRARLKELEVYYNVKSFSISSNAHN